MSLTINENGTAVAETIDGVTMPTDFSFSTVSDFVHGVDVHFEELQCLCLGMANHVEHLQERLRAAESSSEARQEILQWVYEDELPESLTGESYNALFPHSKLDTVRMFPVFAPTHKAMT